MIVMSFESHTLEQKVLLFQFPVQLWVLSNHFTKQIFSDNVRYITLTQYMVMVMVRVIYYMHNYNYEQ